jgi:hypothetical protein
MNLEQLAALGPVLGDAPMAGRDPGPAVACSNGDGR